MELRGAGSRAAPTVALTSGIKAATADCKYRCGARVWFPIAAEHPWRNAGGILRAGMPGSRGWPPRADTWRNAGGILRAEMPGAGRDMQA